MLLRRVLRIAGLDGNVTVGNTTVYRDVRRGSKVTPELRDHILTVAASRPEWLGAFSIAALTAMTGLSRRKLRRLTWGDVDPFRETIKLPNGKNYRYTSHVRQALIALEEIRMRKPGRCRTTDLILRGRSYQDAWTSIRKAAGVGVLKLHDLRVTLLRPK
jgi:integrase